MKLVVFTVCLAFVGCTKAETPAEPASDPPTAETPEEGSPAGDPAAATPEGEGDEGSAAAPAGSAIKKAPDLRVVGEPAIAVVDPGKEPRRALRWEFETESDLSVAMTSATTFRLEASDLEGSGKTSVLPKVRQTFDLDAKPVSGSGTVEVAFEVLDDEMIETPDADPKVHLPAAKGTTGSYRVDSAGVSRDFTLAPAEGLRPDVDLEYLQNLLRMMVFPFPEEPIGVGAKWTITQRVERRGIEMKEETTLELLALRGKNVKLAFKLASRGKRKSTVQVPAGQAHRDEAYTWDAEGKLGTSLTRLVPRRATLDNDLLLRTNVQMDTGESGVVDMEVARSVVMKAP